MTVALGRAGRGRGRNRGGPGLGKLPTALDLQLLVRTVKSESSVIWSLPARFSYLVSSFRRFRCGGQLIMPYTSSCHFL